MYLLYSNFGHKTGGSVNTDSDTTYDVFGNVINWSLAWWTVWHQHYFISIAVIQKCMSHDNYQVQCTIILEQFSGVTKLNNECLSFEGKLWCLGSTLSKILLIEQMLWCKCHFIQWSIESDWIAIYDTLEIRKGNQERWFGLVYR